MRPAMEQTLRTYRLNAEDRQVELVLDVPEDLPDVLGNWDLLLQVLDNLMGNALKFSRPGGPLALRAYPWPDTCSVEGTAITGSCLLYTSPSPRD